MKSDYNLLCSCLFRRRFSSVISTFSLVLAGAVNDVIAFAYGHICPFIFHTSAQLKHKTSFHLISKNALNHIYAISTCLVFVNFNFNEMNAKNISGEHSRRYGTFSDYQ